MTRTAWRSTMRGGVPVTARWTGMVSPRPRLHHGYGLATWHVLRAAVALGRDIRVGLEDTVVLADGTPATSNAELVAAAVALAAG